jgi:TolB protein
MPGANPNALTPSTLYLVNPIGGRYRITTLVPNTAVVGWSPDQRRALTETYASTGWIVQEIELSTGRRLSNFVLHNRSLRGYAGPGGHSLLLSYGGGQQGPSGLERVSTSGLHQLSYPGSTPLIGELDGSTALYRTDGSMFLVTGQHGFAVFDNNGALLRQIRYPSSSICRAGHWWSDQVVQGVCSLLPRAGSSVYGPQNLVLISVGSGQIRQITQAPPPEYGYNVAWPYSGGILAQRSTSCGPGSLDTIRDDGTIRPFSYRLPGGASGQAGLVKVFADQATLVTGNCGGPSRSLIGLNLGTGAATVLLGPGLNGGTVLN